MIELNPKQRITIEEILKHKWFGKIPQMTQEENTSNDSSRIKTI